MDLETIELAAGDFPVCVFSDLHSDRSALGALFAAEPGVRRFFCAGDFVDCREVEVVNSACLADCRERGVNGVRGNHDDNACALTGRLDSRGLDFFWSLPDVLVLTTPFGRVGLFHSSPAGNVPLVNQQGMAAHLETFRSMALATVFVGHSHRAYDFKMDGVRVCNLGHLGFGLVGDAESSYVLLHADGQVERKQL